MLTSETSQSFNKIFGGDEGRTDKKLDVTYRLVDS
jgi:hypothetical protein